MDHMNQNIYKTRGKQLSYRQIIFFCLGGLMGALILLFFLYTYYGFHKECRDHVLQEIGSTAGRIADWTDGCFALDGTKNDRSMAVWEQGVRERVGSGEEIIILDRQGQEVFSTDPALFELCADLSEENAGSRFLQNGGGINLAVGISDSEACGWSFFVFSEAEEEAGDYHFPSERFLILICLTGISFLVAARFIYRPVDRLMKSVVRETGKQAQKEKELEYLNGSLNALKDDSRKLREMMVQKQDKLQEMFTLRLLRGDVTVWEEYNEYLEDFGLNTQKSFATVVAVLKLRDDEETQSNVEEDVICLKIVEEMPKELKQLAWLPPVYNACAIVAILGDDDNEMLHRRIEEYYAGMRKCSEEICGYQMLLGVSATHSEPRMICKAYRESVRALTRSGTEQQEDSGTAGKELEDCHFYYDGEAFSEIPYDMEYEKNMQSGIKNIDKAQCYKAANDFFRYLSKENCSQDKVMVYILRFVDTILLTAMDVRVNLEVLFPNGLRRIYDELLAVLEPARERRYIKKNLVDPILETRSRLMEKRSYSMMEDIEQLIREHRGDISLMECAEIMGVHPTYIWKILKTEKGKTFSDFLEEYKLEEAKSLLLNTDMTVAEIASALNYTNAQNFIRFFSKSTGVTPGKFRKLY